jgi:hypothetical protein
MAIAARVYGCQAKQDQKIAAFGSSYRGMGGISGNKKAARRLLFSASEAGLKPVFP